MWIRKLLGELGRPQKEPTELKCDNQSAIAMCKNEGFHACTKHMDIRYHFIREAVENGTIIITYVPSTENIADIFTKALPRPLFEKFRTGLGLRTFA
jgi:hypothetical protein